MLLLLSAALIGDLIFLPAILASPLGKLFGKERPRSEVESESSKDLGEPTMRIVGELDEEEYPDIHPDSLSHLDNEPDLPDQKFG